MKRVLGLYLLSFLHSHQAHGADNVKVKCMPSTMEITIPKNDPELSSLSASHLSLNNSDCKGVERGGIFHFTTAFNKCGTTTRVTDSEVIYSNVVESRPPKSDVIDYIRQVEIKFSCSYPRKKNLMSRIQVVNILPHMKEYKSQGKFDFSMELYPTDKFQNAHSSVPFIVNLGDLIYIQVKVNSVGNQLSILAQNCYATPERDSDKTKHVLITNSCPENNPKLIEMIKSPASNEQRFSVKAFYFLNTKHTHIYFHCQVIVCDGREANTVCTRGCRSGKRSELYKRTTREEMTFKLTQGPVVVRKESDESRLHRTKSEDAALKSFLYE